MSEHQIIFNYEKVMNQAAELKEIASSLNKVGVSQLEENLGEVSKGWLGDNSESYINKGGKLKTGIGTLSKNVKHTADAVETMARNIYNAEMAALRAARERHNS